MVDEKQCKRQMQKCVITKVPFCYSFSLPSSIETTKEIRNVKKNGHD